MAKSNRKSEQRRQKKAVERKRHQSIQRHLQKFAKGLTLARILENVDRYPIHEALVSRQISSKDLGQGTVFFSRKVGDDRLAMGVFLVDSYLLGVKSAFVSIVSPEEYRGMVRRTAEQETLEEARPECARKLVVEAVKYARRFGFRPDPDYQDAKLIFGGIQTSECETEFEFGKDGKPFYFQSPNDSPARSEEILTTLVSRCGRDGFHYTLVMDPEGIEKLLAEVETD